MAKVYATKPYNLCQIGKETTKGTAVAAAATLPAVAHYWPADDDDAPPAEVTSEDVTAAASAAGFGWNGETWAPA